MVSIWSFEIKNRKIFDLLSLRRIYTWSGIHMNKNDCLQGNMSDCVNTLVEEHGICESYWMDGNLTYLDSGTDLQGSRRPGQRRTGNLENTFWFDLVKMIDHHSCNKWFILSKTCYEKISKIFQKNGIGGNERGTPVMIPIFKSVQRSCLQMRSKIITSVIWLHLFIWLHRRYD